MTKLRPPGPSGHFLTGNAREFRKDQLGFLTRSAREFGDITRLRFFHVPVLLLSNPQHIEFVFTSRNFTKSMSLRLPLQRRIFGRGLLSSDGDGWLRQRRIVQPAFHHDRLTKYAETMIDHTRRTLARWQSGDIRDVYEEMKALALKIAAACFFNSDITRDHAIIRDVCKEITSVFETQGSATWIIDNLLPTPKHLRFRKSIRQLDKIIYQLVAGHQRDHSRFDDLLSMLLSARDENGAPLSDQQLRDELATLFFASYEAVALALSWTCYLLAKYPEVQSAVIAELRQVLRGRAWPSPEDLPSLSYTGRVIKESMRLYPPNRSVGREALNDCEIGGYDVTAGSQILMSQWVVHRDARNFDHPEDFKPGRWTPEFTRQLPRYAYFPFGGGPRVCVGQDFAMMEATLVIATMLSKFSLSPADDRVVEPHPVVLLRPKNGIRIKLRDHDHKGD
jgi:cytochrome P450